MTRFNPRPRVGGDRLGKEVADLGQGFNPRPRVGGDAADLPRDYPPAQRGGKSFCLPWLFCVRGEKKKK